MGIVLEIVLRYTWKTGSQVRGGGGEGTGGGLSIKKMRNTPTLKALDALSKTSILITWCIQTYAEQNYKSVKFFDSIDH